MSMKNSNDKIGNRTRDLPVCSAAPQSTAPPPRGPYIYIYIYIYIYMCVCVYTHTHTHIHTVLLPASSVEVLRNIPGP